MKAITIVTVFICGILVVTAASRELLRAADRMIPGEPIKDALGRYYWKEDWASAEPIDSAYTDESWLSAARNREVWIAHALGEGGANKANSLDAMRTAVSVGFKFFEIDLWLDQNGYLRCFHSDDNGAAPLPFQSGDCTFESVTSLLPADAFLILDIKSDFLRTGEELVRRLRPSESLSRRVIFQLYHPGDLAVFVRWSRTVRLSSPIVTTYSAHRSVRHVEAQLASLNVHALTVPLDLLHQRLATKSLYIALSHPVHDCGALAKARKYGASGFYTLSALIC